MINYDFEHIRKGAVERAKEVARDAHDWPTSVIPDDARRIFAAAKGDMLDSDADLEALANAFRRVGEAQIKEAATSAYGLDCSTEPTS